MLADGALTPTFFHTNFIPDLTQVNLEPFEVCDWFNFVHFAPALGAAALAVTGKSKNEIAVSTAIALRID